MENTQIILSADIEKETGRNSEVCYKYCLRCGRKLKRPENVVRGMGKVCWEKSKTDNQRRLF